MGWSCKLVPRFSVGVPCHSFLLFGFCLMTSWLLRGSTWKGWGAAGFPCRACDSSTMSCQLLEPECLLWAEVSDIWLRTISQQVVINGSCPYSHALQVWLSGNTSSGLWPMSCVSAGRSLLFTVVILGALVAKHRASRLNHLEGTH